MPRNVARLLIELPANRRTPGVLKALSAHDAVHFQCACLGLSTGDPAQNPGRDPVWYRGDTPLGPYAPTRMRHLEGYTQEFGEWKITLDPDQIKDPNSQAARAERNGRTGLLIHGGRNQKKLSKTFGCVRVFDADLAALYGVAGDQRFYVDIVGVP